jgi:hypothetical protein
VNDLESVRHQSEMTMQMVFEIDGDLTRRKSSAAPGNMMERYSLMSSISSRPVCDCTLIRWQDQPAAGVESRLVV